MAFFNIGFFFSETRKYKVNMKSLLLTNFFVAIVKNLQKIEIVVF